MIADGLADLPARMKAKGRLSGGVSADALKSLKALVRPLGVDKEQPPEARYLDTWWSHVEHTLASLDPTCDVQALPRTSIVAMGHILLGE